MSEQEDLFIKGFNSGYILKKYEPTLLATILKNLSPTTDYLEGLFLGKEEFELEKSQQEIEELGHLRNRFESRENDLEKEK